MSTRTTLVPRSEALAERRWFLVDADGVVLGRLASRVASALRGKENPRFTPSVDCGDFVVVVNAAKIRLSGKKEGDKVYARHTGYPGQVRKLTAAQLRERAPEAMIRAAVEGMLPKNRLGRSLARKLKIYRDSGHPHQAQKPQAMAIGD